MAPLMLLLVSACFLVGARGDADMEAKKLFQDYMEWRFSEAPMYATGTGFYRHNDRLKTYTMDAMTKSKMKAEQFQERANNIDPEEVSSASDRVSLTVLKDMLERYLEGFDYRFMTGLNPVHFMSPIMRDLGQVASIAPLYTVGDFENYISRLDHFETMINEFITLMREAIRTGYTLNNVSISRVFAQIDEFTRGGPTNSKLYDAFGDKLNALTTLTPQEKENYRQRGASVVGKFMQALRRLRDFLEREYAPRTRTFFGMNGFSRGREFYAACLRWYLSYNATPEAVHELGLQEVARIETKMQEIMQKQGHNGTIKEYFSRLKEDDRFFKQSGAEILDEYRMIIKDRIDPKLLDFFESLPSVPVEVRGTPTDAGIGSYTRGSADGTRPGYFNANAFRPKDTPTFNMMALTLHEANPGHHMQIMTAMMSDLPSFRKHYEASSGTAVPFLIPSYTAFIEGWGLYAEFLGEEMGMYKDEYEMMGRYNSEMFRACRLVIDTGLHYYGWGRQRAVEYFLNYTSLSRTSAEMEVDRYLTIPGQSCAYKVGEIKIREARSSAAEKLGAKFDLRKFHSFVLNNGPVPLDLLQTLVEKWADEFGAETTCGASSLYSSVLVVVVAVFGALRSAL